MNTLQTAYKILYSLEHRKSADYMGVLISPAKLGVSEDEWLDVIRPLLDECDTFAYKHYSTGNKALWALRPSSAKNAGFPSESETTTDTAIGGMKG